METLLWRMGWLQACIPGFRKGAYFGSGGTEEQMRPTALTNVWPTHTAAV